MSGISRDAWISALAEVGYNDTNDDEALTVREFAMLMGIRLTAARVRLRALVGQGKATLTQKRLKDVMGRSQHTAAYRLLDRKRKRGTS